MWRHDAVCKIEADYIRSADTHLVPLKIDAFADIDIYLKDESSHPTGSLKHRLARSLFLYGLCNGWINQNTTIIESSSGNTAVSEAYFAKLLNLDFVAVMPKSTAQEKIRQIEFYGGKCHLVEDISQITEQCKKLAKELNGHFMDQFTYAERATDWRGNNNIADSIISQMKYERFKTPTWIVMSAGTGGTSATIGRYIKYMNLPSRLLVTDPENSVFFDYYQSGDKSLTITTPSKVEGIGRPRVESSFMANTIDAMIKVKDAQSALAMFWLNKKLGRKVGASTGTNMVGVLKVAQKMAEKGQSGSIVSLICDNGERYANTYYDESWLSQNMATDENYKQYLERLF